MSEQGEANFGDSPVTYGEIVSLLSTNLQMHITEEWIDTDVCRKVISFDTAVKPFPLSGELTKELGLGNRVRARVIGSVEEGLGIAIVLKSMNPFRREAYGFFIQPAKAEADGPGLFDRELEVWEGPAEWPKRKGVYWGAELLDTELVHQSDATTKQSLVHAIRELAAR